LFPGQNVRCKGGNLWNLKEAAKKNAAPLKPMDSRALWNIQFPEEDQGKDAKSKRSFCRQRKKKKKETAMIVRQKPVKQLS